MRAAMRELTVVTALGLLSVSWTGCAGGQDNPGPVRSWIWVEPSCAERVLLEGEQWEVPVEYYLDPAEDKGGTQLYLWVAGPFIYLPDGKYATERQHVPYPDMARAIDALPGRHQHTFTFTVPPALPRNRLLIITYFRDADRTRWPWEVRRDTIWFQRKGGFFELETDKPGNLFTYDEPVRVVARLKNVQQPGAQKTLSYTVRDATGAAVAEGEVGFTVERDGQEVPIELDLKRRGTFLIGAEVDGWEKRETTFCRIPDLLAITKGEPTPFGMTNVVSPGAPERLEEMCQVARRLGLTSCRSFARWYDMEPAPGVYRFDHWARALEIGNEHGIDTWMCLWGPPAWALRGNDGEFGFSYSAFGCDWDAWQAFVEAATTQLNGKLYGWEWLNEITPGGSDRPVDDYVRLCRIATETAKRIDPDIVTIMAGGLWPRSFRLEMLRAGVGQYVDVMPIHYSNGQGVREAQDDLHTFGLDNVAVWDDESAKGINAWNVPALEQLTGTEQSNWVLTEWADELAAGCEKIIYFGGEGDPCGNYSYLLDDLTPRPVAATLAVFTSKLSGAKPVGVFSLGKGGLFHLFDRDGEPVLVCSSYEGAETAPLNVGAAGVRVTDYQGNETPVPAADGVAQVKLAPLRYFIEGADLDVLKAYVVPEIRLHHAALKRSRLVELPRLALMRGRPGTVSIGLTNLYDRDLTGRFRIELPQGWPAPEEAAFALQPGESRDVPIPLAIPADARPEDYACQVRFDFDWSKLPRITKPVVLAVISPEMLGNLYTNGDFEAPDAGGTGPEGFQMDGKTKMWASSEGLGDGLGEHVLRFENTGDQWGWCGRAIDLRGGQTYLYTAWVWNRNMHAGSNVTLTMADGSRQTLHDVQVFTCGNDNPYWQMYAARVKAPPETVQGSFTPVVQGEGWALFDNLRVTLFEGTDFAAECYRAPASPKIDGKLDEWITRCPVPLIGKNQLTVVDDEYAWTSENLGAVGYLMWDDENLYVALRVRDDAHHALTEGETAEGDSVVLAIDPTNRAPEGAAKAFAYYLSSARPGGGSGPHTIFRPPDLSGGLRSGQLYKDSSVYEMAVLPEQGGCTYEARLPFAELGGLSPTVGGKLGLAIQLNDNDGKGPLAHMNWGEGLSPTWRPEGFGVATFVE